MKRYEFITAVLKRLCYPRLGRADKGVVLRYLDRTPYRLLLPGGDKAGAPFARRGNAGQALFGTPRWLCPQVTPPTWPCSRRPMPCTARYPGLPRDTSCNALSMRPPEGSMRHEINSSYPSIIDPNVQPETYLFYLRSDSNLNWN